MKKLDQGESGVADFKINNKIISEGGELSRSIKFTVCKHHNWRGQEWSPYPWQEHHRWYSWLNYLWWGSVKAILLQLASNKPDQIPPWFLKMFAKKLEPILTDLFQASIDQGTLPHQWREANIWGFFFSYKVAPENYRPVSLTITSKI